MQVRNNQQNLTFGALMIKMKQTDLVRSKQLIEEIQNTLYGSGQTVEALTGKYPKNEIITGIDKFVCRFEAPDEVERALKIHFTDGNNPELLGNVEIVNGEDKIREAWKKLSSWVLSKEN